jgi:NitT/TauT family transport system permease protein
MTAITTTTRIGPRQRRNRGPLAKPRRWLRRHQQMLLGLTGFLGFFVLWQIASNRGWINPLFFSSPIDILAAGTREVQVPRFWNDVRVSAFEFGVGFGAAVVLAVPIGIATGWYRRLSYSLDPWLNLINSLPRVALLPLIVLWFGLGAESKITVVFLGVFFSVVIPTVQGVRTVDRRFIDVAHSFKASQRRLFTSVVVPATVPFIVTGLRLGVARGLIGVIVGELYAATDGLGVMITRASQNLQADRMLFGVLIFTIAGIIGVEGVRMGERYFERWRPNMQEQN